MKFSAPFVGFAFAAGLASVLPAAEPRALIESALEKHPPGATDLVPGPARSGSETFEQSFSAPLVVSLDYSPPVRTPLETLLAAVEAGSGPAAMPGAPEPSLENRLVVELAREVIRLRAETDALRAEVDALKKK